MRTALAIVWALLLAGGAYWISRRPKASRPARVIAGDCPSAAQKRGSLHWISQRAMPVNWRLRQNDFIPDGPPPTPGEFAGKYLRCPVAAGDPVIPDELDGLPSVKAVSGKFLYPLPLRTQDAGLLNAGSRISIFEGNNGLVMSTEVAAVDCRDGCYALLQLTAAERLLLDGKEAAQLHWFP